MKIIIMANTIAYVQSLPEKEQVEFEKRLQLNNQSVKWMMKNTKADLQYFIRIG